MGLFEGWHLVIIVLALLLLFGGKKIPELMKGLGKGIKEFKDAQNSDGSSNQQPTNTNTNTNNTNYTAGNPDKPRV